MLIAPLPMLRPTLPPIRSPIRHQLRGEVPLWALAAVFALFGLLAFLALKTQLVRGTGRTLAAYHQIVAQPPLSANITITLP